MDLERKLQRKLNNATTVLVDDLTEVVNRIASVTRTAIGEPESTSRIARISNVSSVSVGNVKSSQANRIQRQEDVASSQVCRRDVDGRRIRLVEDIEQSGPELNLLRLSDVEVLEERDVEVAATRSANVERRLRWSSVRETRYRELAQIVDLLTQPGSAYLRVAEIDGRHCTQTRAGVGAIESVGTVPAERLRCGGYVASESETDRDTALNRRDTRQLPAVEYRIREPVFEITTREFRQAPVVGEIEHVRTIERENSPASVSCIDRVGPCRSITLVGRHSSERFAKGVSGKVLEVSSVVTQRRLQRVIRRCTGKLEDAY